MQLFADLPSEAFRWWGPQAPESLARVVLEVEDRELDGEPWEARLASVLPKIPFPATTHSGRAVVRTSSIRPRFANANLKLPLRILELDAQPGASVAPAILGIFGNHEPDSVKHALLVTSGESWSAPPDWPVVDVLHIGAWPAQADPITNDAERQGTLGWFARWTAAWQTRLLAIHCETEAEASVARTMAQRLIAKGGPAVLIGPVGNPSFWSRFYERLIHDDPLDVAVARAADPGSFPTLFAGSGREEGVRVSNAAVAVVGYVEKEWGPGSLLVRQGIRPAESKPGLIDFAHDFASNWTYEFHETLGLLPMARAVEALRGQLRTGSVVLPGAVGRPVARVGGPPQRFVNAAFFRDVNGSLTRVDSEGPLWTSETYQFGVQIGPLDEITPALDAKAVLEEVFQWSPDQPGVWVEIGVVGIGCEIAGDPVQPLWLPRTGSSDTVHFAVSFPEVGKIAQLRYGLYYKNNLIQSFRMAAYTGLETDDYRTALAEALSVAPERISGWYQARLEYSRSSELDALDSKGAVDSKAERAITIVANQLQGKDILTVKGTDVFETRIYPDDEMPKIVKQVRDLLYKIAYGAPGGQYGFGRYAPDPDGTVKDAIGRLAQAGVRLFLNLAPRPATREALKTALGGERKVIHVAQLVRKKVVPWAFVYDRDYDPAMLEWNGKPVQQGVCLAALGAAEAGLRSAECGTLPECLLKTPGYVESTVACPLRFWGFRHMIETPPQQVEDDEAGAHEEATCIVPKGGLRFTAGLNEELATCSDHWTRLRGLGTWSDPLYARDAILDRLRNEDVDFIYFFCHARGGEFDDSTIDPPYLEFQPKGSGAQQILPQNFAANSTWAHRPLVFLNACGTLGYSPDALSPFLKQLVDGRGASGVLGTEIPVPELLADEVACEFIGRFVKGTNAGTALLEARRKLLCRKNPLGLVYTLYAPAGLAVDVDGDGKCG